LVDVGAAKGEFTSGFLDAFPEARALLFEPTSESFAILRERFRENSQVKIRQHAVGSAKGTVAFHLYEKSEDNSLLISVVQDAELTAGSIKVETLDESLEQSSLLSTVDIIKIDTQGTDLRVLQGARKTIERYRPIILTEAIFVPMYEGQDSYYGILDFMRQQEYHLEGIFEAHCTPEGTLAFADLLFVPEQSYLKFCKSRNYGQFVCADATNLKVQNRTLEQVCRDRLDLIERLQITAEERLKLINDLSRIAEERLSVIHSLDAEVKRLKGGA
jgi:FkbM family methyltransferase